MVIKMYNSLVFKSLMKWQEIEADERNVELHRLCDTTETLLSPGYYYWLAIRTIDN